MKHLNVLLALTAVLSITTTGIAAQNYSERTAKEPFKSQYYIGVGFTPEWQTQLESHNFVPTAGAFFEAQFSRHSGLEAGIYFRFYHEPTWAGGFHPSSKGTAASFRLGYKFWSDIINFSTGMLTDVKIPDKDGYGPYNVYGPYMSISKDFRISKKHQIFIEPEFHINPYFRFNNKFSYQSDAYPPDQSPVATVSLGRYVGTFVGFGAKLKFGL